MTGPPLSLAVGIELASPHLLLALAHPEIWRLRGIGLRADPKKLLQCDCHSSASRITGSRAAHRLGSSGTATRPIPSWAIHRPDGFPGGYTLRSMRDPRRSGTISMMGCPGQDEGEARPAPVLRQIFPSGAAGEHLGGAAPSNPGDSRHAWRPEVSGHAACGRRAERCREGGTGGAVVKAGHRVASVGQ